MRAASVRLSELIGPSVLPSCSLCDPRCWTFLRARVKQRKVAPSTRGSKGKSHEKPASLQRSRARGWGESSEPRKQEAGGGSSTSPALQVCGALEGAWGGGSFFPSLN